MAKKQKNTLGTPHTATDPKSRAAESLASNQTKYTLQHGASEDAGLVDRSENDNMSPEQRFAHRGMQNVPKAKRRRTSYKQGY